MKTGMKTKFEHQLDICKAAEAGEAIQYYDPTHLKWVDLEDRYHLFNFGYNSYRLKIKRSVVLHQYLIRDQNGFYHETTQFFESEADCQSKYGNHIILKRLDHTKVEI